MLGWTIAHRRGRIVSMGLAGLLAHGCSSDDPPEDLNPKEQLDACGLPEACTAWTIWDGCAIPGEGWTYGDHDVCTFESLLVDPPAVVRALHFEPSCGDVAFGERLGLYRWPDGSMTCVLETSAVEFEVRECELPDTTLIESCLAAAQAGEVVSDACLDWQQWGLEMGAEIEPTCR
jgi:hypothetical protein